MDTSDRILYKLYCGFCVEVAEHLGYGNIIVFVFK